MLIEQVLEVEEEGNAPMYYVHYLGWNNRYDEWIRRPCIAENLTWSQNRVRKGRAAATKELKEKKEKEKEVKDTKDTKEAKKEEKEQVKVVNLSMLLGILLSLYLHFANGKLISTANLKM